MYYGDEVWVLLVILVSGFTAVMLLAALGFTIYFIASAFRGSGSKKSRKLDADETRLIQEIHHGLGKMEKRVESLETLLLDDERAKRAQFDRDLRTE